MLLLIVTPVSRRLLALFYQSLDVFDEVGADHIFHRKAVLFVLLGKQPFGLDLFGYFEIDFFVLGPCCTIISRKFTTCFFGLLSDAKRSVNRNYFIIILLFMPIIRFV